MQVKNWAESENTAKALNSLLSN